MPELPEGVEVWWLSCPEQWDVRPVNQAAVEATKLRQAWPTDTDVVAVSDLPAILAAERERVKDALVEHVGEWGLGLLVKDEVTTENWAELRRLVEAVEDRADTDDLCSCGHVRHEHHTWNENVSVGCAHCRCEQFHLDLDALDSTMEKAQQ